MNEIAVFILEQNLARFHQFKRVGSGFGDKFEIFLVIQLCIRKLINGPGIIFSDWNGGQGLDLQIPG